MQAGGLTEWLNVRGVPRDKLRRAVVAGRVDRRVPIRRGFESRTRRLRTTPTASRRAAAFPGTAVGAGEPGVTAGAAVSSRRSRIGRVGRYLPQTFPQIPPTRANPRPTSSVVLPRDTMRVPYETVHKGGQRAAPPPKFSRDPKRSAARIHPPATAPPRAASRHKAPHPTPPGAKRTHRPLLQKVTKSYNVAKTHPLSTFCLLPSSLCPVPTPPPNHDTFPNEPNPAPRPAPSAFIRVHLRFHPLFRLLRASVSPC
jgi:hypothetical protein